MYTLINGRGHHINGTWCWSEGAENESKRKNFTIDCSICEHHFKMPSREKALRFALHTDKCPVCGRSITPGEPW